MKISKLPPISTAQRIQTDVGRVNKISRVNKIQRHEDRINIYDGEKLSDKTYDKKGNIDKSSTIKALIQDSEKATDALKQLVEKLLLRQGHSISSLSTEDIKVDERARIEARNLIADDGPLGVEAVSNRIVDFARSLSGGDPSKFNLLKDAIIKGFGEAEKQLGGLPDISKKTYDSVMEKLDIWEKEIMAD